MARQSGRSARFRSAAEPGRGSELRVAAPRDPQPAGERGDVPQEVLARPPAPAPLRGARLGAARGRGDVLRVRRRLGPHHPARVHRARRAAPDPGRHPARRPPGARQRLALALCPALGRARRPRRSATSRPLGAGHDRLDAGARAALRHPLPRPVRRARDRACPTRRSTSSRRPTSASTSPSPTSRGSSASARACCGPGGLVSFRIDLADHYSYFDKSLSRYHFLRYDDRRWRWANSPLQYQNRLRVTDYRRLVEGAGFEVVSWSPSLPKNAVAELSGLPLAPHFRDGYTPEELGVTVLSFVAGVSRSRAGAARSRPGWPGAGCSGCPAAPRPPRRRPAARPRARRSRAGARSRRAARAPRRARPDRRARRSPRRSARPRAGASGALKRSAGGRVSAFIAPCGRPKRPPSAWAIACAEAEPGERERLARVRRAAQQLGARGSRRADRRRRAAASRRSARRRRARRRRASSFRPLT